MNRKKIWFLLAMVMMLITGCTYYQTAPGVYTTTPPSKFDRSYAAAIGALEGQGVRITTEDRSTGVVQGHRSGIEVNANLRT